MTKPGDKFTQNGSHNQYSQHYNDVDELPDFEEKDRQEEQAKQQKKPNIDFAAILKTFEIRPDEDISPPPVCLSIRQNEQRFVFGTLGNYSVYIGKTKSRKTFTTSIAIGAAISQEETDVCGIEGTFDYNKRNVLCFDLEQGRYHVLKVVKRICRLAKRELPDNLFTYALRSVSTKQRLELIEWAIYNTPNLGLVVIDGIRDLVYDINDNTEATERVNDLLRWTAEKDIHVLTILHTNKNNDLARGTLGTELQNKAELVASVVVDPNDKEISIVSAEYARDKAFEPFAFYIDSQGLPVLADDWTPEKRPPKTNARGQSNTDNTPPPTTPQEFTEEQHESILQRAFSSLPASKYADTCNRIQSAAAYFGYKFGENKAKKFVTHYVDTGRLKKEGQLYVFT